MEIRRGDIFLADLPILKGESIQSGLRPVIIIQNNVGNKYSPTVNIVVGTTKTKNPIPVHAYIAEECGVLKPTTILCEQVMTIDKKRLLKRIGRCTERVLNDVESKLLIQIGVKPLFDVAKANNLADMIIDLEKEIHEYSNNRIIKIYNGLIDQLKVYCKNYNINYLLLLNNRKGHLTESVV